MMKRAIACVCLLACFYLCGCATSPKTEMEFNLAQLKVIEAAAPFQDQVELKPYFDQAVGYLVLPTTFRAGTGFGGAWGHGWLVEGGKVTNKVYHWQFFCGADLGFQLYQQIIFFKDEAAMAEFKRTGVVFQFAGQAFATAVLWGAGATPSYSDGTALFTLIDGGLLLEGSVGVHTFHVLK